MTLGRRALNRATLARQLLLSRACLDTSEALCRLGGLQAQTAQTWYVGLWTRLAGYTPRETSALLGRGDLVRMALMRGTIHVVTADDARWLRPLVDPVIHRGTMGAFGRDLRDVDRDELVALARSLLASRALTFTELGRSLAERWPGRAPQSLGNAARAWLPLVQSPPRGMWRRSAKAAHQLLPSPLVGAPVDRLVMRYLSAFGPATVRDCQQWSGLTRLAEVFERLGPSLVSFPGGLFDLPSALVPTPTRRRPYVFSTTSTICCFRTTIGGGWSATSTTRVRARAAGTWKCHGRCWWTVSSRPPGGRQKAD